MEPVAGANLPWRTTRYHFGPAGRLIALDLKTGGWRNLAPGVTEALHPLELDLPASRDVITGANPLNDFDACGSRIRVLKWQKRPRLFSFDLGSGSLDSVYALPTVSAERFVSTPDCGILIGVNKSQSLFNEFDHKGCLLSEFGQVRGFSVEGYELTDEEAHALAQPAVAAFLRDDLFVAFDHLPVIQRYDASRRLVFQKNLVAPTIRHILQDFSSSGGSCDGVQHAFSDSPVPIISRAIANIDERLFLLVSNRLLEIDETGVLLREWTAPPSLTLLTLVGDGSRLVLGTPRGLYWVRNIKDGD